MPRMNTSVEGFCDVVQSSAKVYTLVSGKLVSLLRKKLISLLFFTFRFVLLNVYFYFSLFDLSWQNCLRANWLCGKNVPGEDICGKDVHSKGVYGETT